MELFRPFVPAPAELPRRLASPFVEGRPHPLAERAADLLVEALERDSWGVRAALEAPGGGKMFGVLALVAPDGRVGWIAAFSGMFGGRWNQPGFVPPLFDEAERRAFFPAGEAALAALEARSRALTVGEEATSLRARTAAIDAQCEAELTELVERHRARRAERRDRRRALEVASLVPEAKAALLHALDEESRADTREKRRLEVAHTALRGPIAEHLAELEREVHALDTERRELSRTLFARLVDGYVIENFAGERRTLVELFAPDAPPGGAGDCAAPKLLGWAARHGYRPLAIAEFWWGAPPPTGDRISGRYYPACRRKCGPILPFMLRGLEVDAAPIHATGRFGDDLPRVIFEDEHLILVEKPEGMLSVPGRGGALRDSVLVRVQRRYPAAEGPMIVHRLDLDTSGILLVAKTSATHARLQAQFACREIEKRYVAWLEGQVAEETGVIDLPLRVDLDDRPRQIHDPIHGKPAVTEYRVLERARARTRVAFFPKTGRTHQLRVHAAHPLGLGAPIVGDRLYGHVAERLFLHAEALAFVHPSTGARMSFEVPAPF